MSKLKELKDNPLRHPTQLSILDSLRAICDDLEDCPDQLKSRKESMKYSLAWAKIAEAIELLEDNAEETITQL